MHDDGANVAPPGTSPHPKMFDDDDPFLARVRALALAFPGSDQKVSHGRPAFFTKKVFAYFGGSSKVDGDWVQHPRSLVVSVDRDDRHALLHETRAYLPAYLGPSGWVGIDLDERTDWGEIFELLDASYRLTAPTRLVQQLGTPGTENPPDKQIRRAGSGSGSG